MRSAVSAEGAGGELGEELSGLLDVEAGRVEHLHGVLVALLVVAEEVGVELGRPGNAAFEEGEAQVGMTSGYPSHDERAADRLLGGRRNCPDGCRRSSVGDTRLPHP